MSKTIKAVFTGRFCRTQRVFQFDTDDKLQIVNVDLPASFTVDFSNSKTGDSVSVLATSDTVQIPPDLFVPGSEIYAWIWLSDSNGGHTRCEATIPIDPRARRTGTEPTPAQASAWDEAVDTLNETVEGIPAVVNAALTEAKESGEFDGAPGVGVPSGGSTGQVLKKASGTDYDTVWADESGGGGTSDYNDLSNKPSIEGVTLSGNKTAAQLGLAKASDIPAVPVQSVNGKTGAVELNASDVGAGTYSKPSGGIPKSDLAAAVQTSLGKADTALQSAPVTSVNGQTGAVTLTIPTTAADVGAIAAPANPSSAQDLVYLNGAWVAADKLYIVNCTPTALDYSGTMDKTVAEIYAAYQAGKSIVFRLWTAVDSHFDTVGTMFWTSGDVTYPSFNAFIVLSDPYNSIVFAYTGATNNGALATYGTSIYPLSTSACIPAPATPTTGDFLCWNGSSWAATSLSTWQGGNY